MQLRFWGTSILAALVLLAGCARTEEDEGGTESIVIEEPPITPLDPVTRDVDVHDGIIGVKPSVVDGDPPPMVLPEDPALYFAQLLKYWTFDRFVWDRDQPVRLDPILETRVLAKAQPDECFTEVGGPYPVLEQGQCTEGKEKRNQAYVWGLTKVGRYVWFGTAANVLCQAQSSLLPGGLVEDPPTQVNDYYVCEFEDAASGTGDWRPPRIYRYDLETETLEDLAIGPAAALLSQTAGVRSAGAIGDIAFLGGPSISGTGINLFAFKASTGALLDAQSFPQYSDIRSWVEHQGVLYTGVGVGTVRGHSQHGGFVLRWIGDEQHPLYFEEVGHLDSQASNLAVHRGRLYVTTWPTQNERDPADFRVAGLYQSPVIPPDGLHECLQCRWTKIWSITDYDPDLIAARTTGGGAIASHEGSLYFGTMHVPFIATLAAIQAHQTGLLNLDADLDGELGAAELLATVLGTHRSTTLFRGEDLCTPAARIRPVYGELYLPAYDPSVRAYRVEPTAQFANRLGEEPLWGASGFGNFFNQYTWVAQVFEGRLFLGTFDALQVERAGASGFLPLPFDRRGVIDPVVYQGLIEKLGARIPIEGADLMRIDDCSGEAHGESFSGLGNDVNYGFRTMVEGDGMLFIGTANAMNLSPKGGWELLGNELQCSEPDAEPAAPVEEPAATLDVP